MQNDAPGRPRWSSALLLGIVLGAGLAVAGVWLGGGRMRSPGDDSAEAGFARDMATHHAQAAEMALVVRDASTDVRLRTLAYDILVTQTAQRGVFMGWLQQWGLPQASSRPRMAWMPMHEHGSAMTVAPGEGLMPGMADGTEMEKLARATGRDAEVLFLQLMIRHHEGGVLMARAVLAQSRREDVVTMAKAIDSTQSGEIALMMEMLGLRGARPLPSMLK